MFQDTVSRDTAFSASFQASPAAFLAFPTRQNPDTVYPAPGEQNRPRGNKDFNVAIWVEDTMVSVVYPYDYTETRKI